MIRSSAVALLSLCTLLTSVPCAQDPALGEVPLAAAPGWDARLLLDNGDTGVWTVASFPVFEQYAAPEVVALDDEGRCTVLVSYSGKWTPLPRIHDGAWLGGLAHGDVDPRIAGAELYTGGKKGNLYQLVPHRHGALDARLIAHVEGREIHTILAGELDPTNGSRELLVFTRPGGLYRVVPTADPGGFDVEPLGELPGRVRDALVLPSAPGGELRIATASRDGGLRLLSLASAGPRWETILDESMGMGRLAIDRRAEEVVLYVTLDDGRVLRLVEEAATWSVETIYAGPQGLRGVAVGRFHPDPNVESLVVFGYSGKVQMLTRSPGMAWEVETLFHDRDRGHSLSVAELDGRNGTDEILGSGYGGRVFMLARPPGYGLAGVGTDPDAPLELERTPGASSPGPAFEIICSPDVQAEPFEGRAFVFLSKAEREPRKVTHPARLEPVISADFVNAAPGDSMRIDGLNARAFPASLAELEGGEYWVQAVLDADPHAPWPGTAVGNPCSAPVRVVLGGGRAPTVRLECDRRVPATNPTDTRYVRVVEVESALLSEFHGRPMHLRAMVHLPEAWFQDEGRRFPMLLSLSGFGASLGGFVSVPWPAAPIDGEPFLTVYPDPSCQFGHSAFFNSEVNGPWGDAFVEELLPALQERFRAVDHREARILTGHSSGGWAALWLIARYPLTFGAAWARSPDPLDFRDFMGVDLYDEDSNLFVDAAGRPRPFCKLGDWTVNYTFEHAAREAVLRGGVLSYFEALLGAPDPEGLPERLFDRTTGALIPEVVQRWRQHDLSAYLRDRWGELGPLLDGRLVITVADNDNFLLQGSVDLFGHELRALGAKVDVRLLSGDHFTRLDSTASADRTRSVVDRFRQWRTAQSEMGAH